MSNGTMKPMPTHPQPARTALVIFAKAPVPGQVKTRSVSSAHG